MLKTNKYKTLPFSVVTIIITTLICFVLTYQFSWKGNDGEGYKRIIDGDGKGYYLYLHNIFLNRNIANQTPDNRFILEEAGRGVNKYFAGTAIAISPFFGIAYLIAYFQNDKLDGYSFPFQSAVSFAALFYLLAGLFFLRRFLKLYNLSDTTISIVILLCVFGTNLLTYCILEPSLSHIYSFAFISAFVYLTKKLFNTADTKYLIYALAVLAFIILIRPVNLIIILLLPFLAGSTGNIKKIFILKCKPVDFFWGILIFVCIVSIQMFLWYIQTGKIIIWSYKNEGFDFSHPHFWDFLFSFRKGFFIYTPLMFAALFGLVFIDKKSKFEFISFILFILQLFYILSSWWNWYYGPSFGQRVMVEFYPVFALMLAFLIEKPQSKFIKTIILTIAAIFMVMNLIQTYQYQSQIISSWDMNFNKYRYTFLKTSPEFKDCLGGNNDILPYNSTKKLLFSVNNDFEREYPFCLVNNVIFDSSSKSKVCSFHNTEYNAMVNISVDSSFISERGLFAGLNLEIYQPDEENSNKEYLVIDISDSAGKNYFYYSFHLNETPDDAYKKWNKTNYTIEIPSIRNVNDKMSIYIWNCGKENFYIDNFKLRIYSIH